MLGIPCIFFSQRTIVGLCQCHLWMGYFNHYRDRPCHAQLQAEERCTPSQLLQLRLSWSQSMVQSKFIVSSKAIGMSKKRLIFFKVYRNSLIISEINFMSSG
jgi:hypothetical protein